MPIHWKAEPTSDPRELVFRRSRQVFPEKHLRKSSNTCTFSESHEVRASNNQLFGLVIKSHYNTNCNSLNTHRTSASCCSDIFQSAMLFHGTTTTWLFCVTILSVNMWSVIIDTPTDIHVHVLVVCWYTQCVQGSCRGYYTPPHTHTHKHTHTHTPTIEKIHVIALCTLVHWIYCPYVTCALGIDPETRPKFRLCFRLYYWPHFLSWVLDILIFYHLKILKRFFNEK